MAKRSNTARKRTATNLDAQVKPPKASAQESKVNIRCLVHANYSIVGGVTGTKYNFSGAGSTLPVFSEDVTSLLEKNGKKKTCCGDAAMKIVFEIA